MTSESEQDPSAGRVQPGTGGVVQRFRWWQPFSRALFHISLPDVDSTRHSWTVDVRLLGDSDGEVRAHLYRDGISVARSKLPAVFDVPGGVIEVAASMFGLRRCHFVSADGRARQLLPEPSSAEGRRAHLHRRHPAASRVIGAASFVILAVALVLGIPQLLEQVSQLPPVADVFGTFTSPVHLPPWLNISLLVAALAASTERALRLRYNWLLDGSVFDGED